MRIFLSYLRITLFFFINMNKLSFSIPHFIPSFRYLKLVFLFSYLSHDLQLIVKLGNKIYHPLDSNLPNCDSSNLMQIKMQLIHLRSFILIVYLHRTRTSLQPIFELLNFTLLPVSFSFFHLTVTLSNLL